MGDTVKIRGTDKEGKAVTLSKSAPLQMSLFQHFVPDDGRSSNSIEFYDAIPKYSYSRTLQRQRETESGSPDARTPAKYLPTLERQFQFTDREAGTSVTYHVTISPARVKNKDGQEKEFYPTEREEFIEEALRKIAASHPNGLYLNDQAGVEFTLKQLKKELAATGHDMRLDAIIDAINVASKSHLDVRNPEGKYVLQAPIFPVVLLPTRKEWQARPSTAKAYVQFNPLITRSINRLTFRQYNYLTGMTCKSHLARWLHKRLAHRFRHADYTNTYTIRATTLMRDSGLFPRTRKDGSLRDNIRIIDSALDELVAKQDLLRYEKNVAYGRTGGRRKIQDVTYTLYPHYAYVADMKAANTRHRMITDMAQGTLPD
jgi:hypothetical protein